MKTLRLALLAGGAASAVVLAVWLFALLRRPVSPQAACVAAIEALLEQDTERLFALMSDLEKDSQNIREQDFKRFLDSFVYPRMSGFEPVGTTSTKSFGYSNNEARVIQRVAKGRKSFDLSFYASPAGRDDSTVNHMVLSLFLAAHQASLPPGPPPAGQDRMRSLADTIESNLDRLKQSGIPGFATMSGESGVGPTYTWEVYAERQRDLSNGRNLDKWRNYGK